MMLEQLKGKRPLKLAVICAHDSEVLLSLKEATDRKIIEPILLGDRDKIEALIKNNNLNMKAKIVDCGSDEATAEASVKTVSEGNADLLMKGLVASSTMLKAVLNKEWGLRTGSLLSHIALFMLKEQSKKNLILTDAGINISPDLSQKKAIIENAVDFAHKLGIVTPKVAIICAVETVNPDMQATLDAAALSKMNDRNQIKGCIVDGPLALDNALSEDAATHKGIKSQVAGNADILITPNVEAGNMLYKMLDFFAPGNSACIVAGAKRPIILTSRAHTHEVKFNSIVLASIIAHEQMR